MTTITNTSSNTSLLPDEDYILSMEEMHYHSIVSDIAEAISNRSTFNVLLDVMKRVDNPQEQHLVHQLVRLLEAYENRLLSFTPASDLLKPNDKWCQ